MQVIPRAQQVIYKHPNEMELTVKLVPPLEARQYVNLVTAPKCGTHLLVSMLHQFGIKYKFPNGCPHITLTGISKATHLKNNEKYIGTLRDPRDFFISLIQWIDSAKDRSVPDAYKNVDMDTKLSWAINGTTPAQYKGLTSFPSHIQALYDLDALSKNPSPSNLLLLFFEDLIGPELGGSSGEAQLNSIRKILDFTGTVASDEKIKEVAKAMIGGSITYTPKKKVGRWKDYFKEHHVRDFKLKHNALLVSLSYEKDENWSLESEPVAQS